MNEVALLDELAVNATAATTVQVVSGWLLRAATDLPFRRCNSVFPNGGTTVVDDTTLETAAAFYRSRGLPVRYQISPAARPADLDEQLAARGYGIEAPVDILVAGTRDVIARTDTEWRAMTAAGIDDVWARAYGRLHAPDDPMAARIEAYGRLMRTVGPATVVATVDHDDGPAGLGFGVVERGWIGVFGMATRADARRRGVATAVLHALARAGASLNASRCYLQVEVDNAAAHTLYERAGFSRSYSYHYRVSA